MKTLVLILAVVSGSAATADQAATMTCTGTNVILEAKSPYLGENSKFRQELFVLKTLDNDGETKNTAYFLDVEQDFGGKQSCFGAGSLLYSGRNQVKGTFDLCIHMWKDESDGGTIRQTSSGYISYNHGPLKGKSESVSCVLE